MGHPSVTGPARELADQAREILTRHERDAWELGRVVATARARGERKDCGVDGPNPDARFGRWVSTNFADTQSSTLLNARRLWEVFSDRREEVSFIPQSGLYALAEPHPEFPDKSPVEINRPFISMADSAPACFILICRDTHMSTKGHQCFCGVNDD